MEWKGCGRRQSLPNRKGLPWHLHVGTLETLARAIIVQAGIEVEHLPKRFLLSQLLELLLDQLGSE
jgi:hypothetical protein